MLRWSEVGSVSEGTGVSSLCGRVGRRGDERAEAGQRRWVASHVRDLDGLLTSPCLIRVWSRG